MKNTFVNSKAFWIILLVVCIATLLPVVSAQIEHLGTFKQGDCIKLLQSCGNCTWTNITSVMYPNSSSALGIVPMTQIGTEFNYSCGPSSVIGSYIVNGKSNLNGITTVWAYDYNVTPTGDTRGYGIFIVLLICAFFLFAIDYFVETGYLAFLSGVLFTITGVYSMIYGIGDLSELWTRAIALISIGVGLIFMLGSAYDLVWGDKEDDGGLED